jgi:hypothetical protein
VFNELRHPAYADQDDGIVFYDADDRCWSVREVDAETVPGGRGVRCLVFTSSGSIRRVWQYPAAWRRLPDAGMAELLQAL